MTTQDECARLDCRQPASDPVHRIAQKPYFREVDRWTEWGNDPYEALAAFLTGSNHNVTHGELRAAIRDLDLTLREKP